jgi:hypothetical protein
MPVILATWEAEIRPAQANSLKDPISKITRAKWTEGVVQEVQHLFYKLEALSSNQIAAAATTKIKPF